MIKLRTFLVATTAIATATLTLSAQDKDKPFEGWYGGIEGGFDRTEAFTIDDNSFYYGLNLGYRRQTERNWVWGLEASFGDTNFNDDIPLGGVVPQIDAPSIDISSDFQWSASLSVGKAFDDNLISLRFGTIGTQFSVSDRLLVNSGGEPFAAGPSNFHEQGYLAGIQYERAITDRINFKLGFDYIDYGNGLEQYQPKAGINIKF